MPGSHSSPVLRGIGLPGQGRPVIGIASTTDHVQHLTVKCFWGDRVEREALELMGDHTWIGAPCQASQLEESLNRNLADTPSKAFGIEITSDGPAGSFSAFGMTTKTISRGSSIYAGLPFIDPGMMKSGATVFPGVSSATLFEKSGVGPSVVTVANFANRPASVHVEYISNSSGNDAGKTETIKQLQLAPGQTEIVQLIPHQRSTSNMDGSLIVGSSLLPGDVVANIGLASSKFSGYLGIEGHDATTLENGGKHPWQLGSEKGDDATLILFNNSPDKQYFPVTISSSSPLWTKQVEIPAMSTREISFRKLVEKGTPDDKGRRLSAEVRSGTVTWHAPKPHSGRGRLVERSTAPFSERSFSCVGQETLCTYMGSLWVDTVNIAVGGQDYLGYAYSNTCQSGDPYSGSPCGDFDMGVEYDNIAVNWSGCNHASGCSSWGMDNPVLLHGSSPGHDDIFVQMQDLSAPGCYAYAQGYANVKPTITGDQNLWYFNGYSPSNYSTSITLNGNGSGTWSVSQADSKVQLSTTSGSSTTVTPTGSYFSTSNGDVSITLTVDGVTSDPFTLTVRRPDRAVYGYTSDTCDATFGFISAISYALQDQVHDPLPNSIDANEYFSSGITADYGGTNWVFTNPNGYQTSGNTLTDLISGMNLNYAPYGPWNPTPNCNASDPTKVHHRSQQFYVGSQAVGTGTLIDAQIPGTATFTNTHQIQRYIGHGTHE